MKTPSRTKVVEVFKTNILYQEQSKAIVEHLKKEFPTFRINMDLTDCDKILRVEGYQVFPDRIIDMVTLFGFECLVLE